MGWGFDIITLLCLSIGEGPVKNIKKPDPTSRKKTNLYNMREKKISFMIIKNLIFSFGRTFSRRATNLIFFLS